ncbi:dihydrolipoamide acetyltransferase family protein [Saccharicrinis aurantiacus]|uniref:dihydrolipoamide acetyltransferase family protein n=1 Tax=Saccharicrinis aurantiacus TaxID=1849719 RepID=UPI00249032D6|nr:dihydrolipoamide acetyltransferase family protein [Saccharicrinis aurantiacus]
MATVVIMPRQGQSVESCIFTEWFFKVGDQIKKGDILFAYETDKASFEEEATEAGTLLEVFCNEGDEVPVLQNIAVIGAPGENIEEYRGANTSQLEEVPVVQEASEEKIEDIKEELVVQTKERGSSEDVKISPRAKKLANSNSVPFETLVGSGPEGRIIERDIQAYIAATPKVTPLAREIIKQEELLVSDSGTGLAGAVTSSDLSSVNPVYAEDYEIKKLPNIRKLIAKAMHASLQNSAQLTHHLGADARNIMQLRKTIKATEGAPNITINDLVCFAVIKALKKFPDANAHFLGDSVKYFNKVHLGLAVDTDRGLMVPVIKNADDLSIGGLSRQFKEVAESCKKGSVDPELLSSEAASFTVSNLGNYGVEMFTPVINLPQVAILGVNTIVPRPTDLGGGVYGFVPFMGLSLTYDHQALDGGLATRFLKQIAIEIENLQIDI